MKVLKITPHYLIIQVKLMCQEDQGLREADY